MYNAQIGYPNTSFLFFYLTGTVSKFITYLNACIAVFFNTNN